MKKQYRPFIELAALLGFTLFLFCNHLFSQSSWTAKPFDQKAFIENKGQFSSDVLFSVSRDGVELYFTSKGLKYRHDELIRTRGKEGTPGPFRSEFEKEAEEKRNSVKVVPHYLSVEWQGTNPAVNVIAEEAVSCYYTYGDAAAPVRAAAYKRIIYKNIYDKVDIEYTFPKDSGGIKYSIILHPGADASAIQMKYSGAKRISLTADGNIEVQSSFGKFTDHAPKTFYQNTRVGPAQGEEIPADRIIPSSFSLNNDVVSFSIPYEKLVSALGQPGGIVVIDPWVVNPGFTTDNKAFDIAKDAAGNVYVYGGGGGASVWKLKKFDPSGNPVWTYNTAYVSTSNGYYGDLAVDAAGNSYIIEGYGGGGIQKINTGGTATWNVSHGAYEFWCLAFNCSFTKLYLACGYAGGPATPTNSIANVNLNTGALSGGTVLNSGAAEPRAIGWGPNGNIYLVSCLPGNMVVGVTPAFATVFSVPSGYNLAYNGPAYANGALACSGQNGIAANNKYVYTSDGLVLNKRNVQTGAFISTVNIPGGAAGANSGVVVDDCGNVYAGSSNGVYKYDSLLTFVSSAATSGPVYCVYAGSGGDVLASGNGFIASLNLSYCTLNLTVNPSSTNANCSGPNSGTATVNPAGGSSPYTFFWSNSQTTQSISGLAVGNYSVLVTDASSCKQSSATFTISATSALTVTATATAACGLNSGSATANPSGGSGTYTYNWSSGGSNATATGLNAGTYSVSVTDAGGCTGTTSITVPSGSITATAGPSSTICTGQSITLTSSGGTNYSWNTGATTSAINAIPTGTATYSVLVSSGSCSATATASVTVNPLPVVSVSGNTTICGGSTATLTASGGISYSWSTGATSTVVTVSPSSFTSYTVTATNANGCSSKATVSITVSSPPIANLSGTTVCSGQAATLSASGGGNYNWNTGSTASTITIFPTANTTYSVIVSVGNCADTASAIVTVNPAPAVSISGNLNLCTGQGTTLTASGSNNYVWNNGSTTTSVTVIPTSTSTYSVVSTNGTCSGSASAIVVVTTLPIAIVSNATICAGQTATLTASGGGTYNWSTGSTASTITIFPTANTTYSVIVSAGNCADTASAIVTVNPVPAVSISGNLNLCNGQATTLTAAGGNNYVWNNGSTTSSVTIIPTSTTTYSVVSTNGTCSGSASATVVVTTPPIVIVSNATICAGQTATLTASGGGTYNWSNGSTINPIYVSPAATTTYSVIVSIGNCSVAASAFVTVNSNPVANTSGNVTVTSGNSITLGANGGGTYAWNNGSTSSVINVAPALTTVYCVTVTNNNCKDTACVTVYVNQPDCTPTFWLPNAFSPNGDKANDVFNIFYGNTQCIEKFEFHIYDRWGELIFASTDPMAVWDGTYKGRAESAAVFVYYMKATLISGSEVIREGNVSLVR